MINQKTWDEAPHLQQELAGVLRSRVMLIALELIKEKGLSSTQPIGNTPLMEWFALMGAKKDGYLECLKNLQLLAEPPPIRPPERKPWVSPERENQPDADSNSAF